MAQRLTEPQFGRKPLSPETVSFIAALGIAFGRMPEEAEVILYLNSSPQERQAQIQKAQDRKDQGRWVYY